MPFNYWVPMSSIAAVSDLTDEIKKRVTRLGVWPDITGLCLHLGEPDGLMINAVDTLSEVILDPKVETVTVTASMKKPYPPIIYSRVRLLPRNPNRG